MCTYTIPNSLTSESPDVNSGSNRETHNGRGGFILAHCESERIPVRTLPCMSRGTQEIRCTGTQMARQFVHSCLRWRTGGIAHSPPSHQPLRTTARDRFTRNTSRHQQPSRHLEHREGQVGIRGILPTTASLSFRATEVKRRKLFAFNHPWLVHRSWNPGVSLQPNPDDDKRSGVVRD